MTPELMATRHSHACDGSGEISITRVALAEPPRHKQDAISDLICTWNSPLLPAGCKGRPLPPDMKNPAAFFFPVCAHADRQA